jgi:hypothetical protein
MGRFTLYALRFPEIFFHELCERGDRRRFVRPIGAEPNRVPLADGDIQQPNRRERDRL